MQRAALIGGLKQALKRARLTYSDVAEALELSEASVKRLFHQRDMSLSRLEAIATLAGVSLTQLAESLETETPLLSELSREQETELISDPKLLLMAYMLANGSNPDDVVARFHVEPDERHDILRRLERIGIIERQPNDRIRMLMARNFRWRPEGPVQALFLEYIQRDFFSDRFEGDDAALYFLGGFLSPSSRRALCKRIEQLAVEVDELSRQDAKLNRDERQPSGAVLALRDWEFEAFAKLRRDDPS
ncbi:MAG: helix-turn-helix transcriptional regulator [Pseudomonadota bacterium]